MIEGDQTETDVSCFMTDDNNPSEKCEHQNAGIMTNLRDI